MDAARRRHSRTSACAYRTRRTTADWPVADAGLDLVPVPEAGRLLRAIITIDDRFLFLHPERTKPSGETEWRGGAPILALLQRGINDHTLRDDLSANHLGQLLGGLVQPALTAGPSVRFAPQENHPDCQGHRAAEPPAARLRPEPGLVRDRRPGLRTAGLDPDARLARPGPPLGTQKAPPADLRRRRAARTRQSAATAPAAQRWPWAAEITTAITRLQATAPG
jgi:hypothetical protein